MFIGIDLGTSAVKLILVKYDGSIVRTVSKKYDLIIPNPSWSEQDPNMWFLQTMEGLKELVKDYENEVEGISFSGQMHGLVILDEFDNILRNAILWNDQRTVKEVDFLNQEIGINSLLKYTGNIALTGLTAPKVLWVKNNEPELFAKISKVMLPKDYLIYKLSGKFASDVSDLSGTLYFNPKTRNYSEEMLEILGLSRTMLPKVYESYDVVGDLLTNIKKDLNINKNVKIIAGGGDQAVGAIGVGVVGDGECSISLGTSGVIFVSSDKFVVDNQSYLQSYAHANGKYHIMAVMLNAAGSVKWWNENIFNNYDYDEYFRNVDLAKFNDDLFFLPYLTGERSPINDPYARGVMYGLGIHHTKKDLDLAVVEGVTFALKDSFELIKKLGIDIKKVKITGGGAKSDVWVQMIANILGIEVVKLKTEEGPALGAAILAMVGCKKYKNIAEACERIIDFEKVFLINKKVANIYENKYNKFKLIYPNVKILSKK